MFYHYLNETMHYEVIGSGKPVILIHGFGCDLNLMKGCMEPILCALSGYKRIYVDLPGMGNSGANPAFASSDKILEILTAFCKDTIQENFLLVGESFGGYLARGLLAVWKEKVDGLMLLCPVVIPNRQSRRLPETDVRFLDPAYLECLETEDKLSFCEYAVLANAQTHKRYKEEILPGAKQANDSFLRLLNQNYSFTMDVDEVIKNMNFSKPALFICGRQDTCVGYEDLWGLLESYPRATFSVVDVAGHNLQIEQPELFHSLVYNWILRTENDKTPGGNHMLIREETPEDYDEVYDLIKEAFQNAEHRDGNEQDLAAALRKGEAFVPGLSLVAEINGKLAGHILFSEAKVGTDTVLVLAPLSVRPEFQKMGVGTALIRAGHKIAGGLGYPYSLVLGSEFYYPRLGYLPAEQFGVEVPVGIPSANFMAIRLLENAKPIRGAVTYAKEFGIV